MAEQDKVAPPEQAPPNVVVDNSGEVPVQPVSTTDPTLDDNTNPKVFFDGADPRNIPPHDSNEQLHISAGKRMAAETSSMSAAAKKRREAVEAAYDNTKDVRDVIGDDEAGGGDQAEAVAKEQRKMHQEARRQAPEGRSSKSQSTQKS
jgi:hypothetical protein